MVPLDVGAPADVKIQGEIAAAVQLYQLEGDFPPGGFGDVQVDFYRVEPGLHACQVRAETDQPAVIGGYDLVDAVPEQEAPVHG